MQETDEEEAKKIYHNRKRGLQKDCVRGLLPAGRKTPFELTRREEDGHRWTKPKMWVDNCRSSVDTYLELTHTTHRDLARLKFN